jgi:DinB family protein
MDIVDFFLLHHARVHSSEVAEVEGGSLADQTLADLADASLRTCPEAGINSLVWLLWHMARSEDAYINLLLMKRPQVLDRSEWTGRLRVERRDTGSGMAHTGGISSLSQWG